MSFNSPLSSEKADRLIGLFEVSPGERILDAGCGRGEFLIRAIEATGAAGLGIDLDADVIAAARQPASRRLPDAAIEFRQADLRQASLAADSFSVAICLGATHAFASGEPAYRTTLQSLIRLVRPGGQILIGEGYWKQPPTAEYLQLIGEPVGIYRDHEGNIEFAQQFGLTPMYAAVANDDEWDHFEWTHRAEIESRAALDPHNQAHAAKRQRSRAWCAAYLRWGRATMGFGFYLFRKPSSAG